MTPARAHLIARVCLLVDLALVVGALLVAARTGHVLTGVVLTAATSATAALACLRIWGRH